MFAQAHCLDAKLVITPEDFANMEHLGIVQLSKGPMASSLHMVPKSDGQWLPCRDLHNITENDH